MPLTEEQKAAVATLATADPKEAADALHADANPVYQHAYRIGFGTAKGEYTNADGTGKMDLALQAKTAAEAAAQEAKEALSQAASGDEATAAQIAALERAAQEAKDAKDAAEAAADARVKGVYRTAQEATLLAKLVSQGVDEDYARGAVLPNASGRIRIDALTEDGPTVSFLGADSVPLSGGLDALAAELASGVAPKFKTSKVDTGGGATNGGTGGGTDVTRILASVDAQYGANDTKKAAQERLGLN